jgi:hypothetical protein
MRSKSWPWRVRRVTRIASPILYNSGSGLRYIAMLEKADFSLYSSIVQYITLDNYHFVLVLVHLVVFVLLSIVYLDTLAGVTLSLKPLSS